MARAKATSSSYYEEVAVKGQRCLRIRATGKPVAWSDKDDAAWRSYVAETMAAAPQPEV